MSNNNTQIDIDHPLDEQSKQIIKCFTSIIDALITLNNKYEYSSSTDYKEDYDDFIEKSNNFINCSDEQAKPIQTIRQKIDSITSNVTHQHKINKGTIKPVYGETFKVKNFKDDIIRLHKLFILLMMYLVTDKTMLKEMLEMYGTKYRENELYDEVAIKMGFKSKNKKRRSKQRSKQRSKRTSKKRSTKLSTKQRSKKQRSKKRSTNQSKK